MSWIRVDTPFDRYNTDVFNDASRSGARYIISYPPAIVELTDTRAPIRLPFDASTTTPINDCATTCVDGTMFLYLSRPVIVHLPMLSAGTRSKQDISVCVATTGPLDRRNVDVDCIRSSSTSTVTV